VVRAAKSLSSEAYGVRLSTGALLAEEELADKRLHYRKLTGIGPRTGWVSITLKGKALVSKTEKRIEDLDHDLRGDHVASQASLEPPKSSEAASDGSLGSGSRTLSGAQAVLLALESSAVPKKSGGACQESDPASGVSSAALPNGTETLALARRNHRAEESAPVSKVAMFQDATDSQQVTKLQERLDALQRPVKALLRTRSAIESGSASLAQHARLHELQQQLVKALMKVQAAADELDPPSSTPPRMQLRCASPNCPFLVHSREALGGFCCAACHKRSQLKPWSSPAAAQHAKYHQHRGGYQSGVGSALQPWGRNRPGYPAGTARPYRMVLPASLQEAALPPQPLEAERHDARCEQRRAPAGARPASHQSKPMEAEQLAEVELEEAVRLVKARSPKLRDGLENTWLEANPKWSRSGAGAVGKWASSIVHDEWGDPDTHGPRQLLEGGVWISRKGQTVDQWLVFDLGSSQLVSEVRTRGNHTCTRFNARSMHWQTGDGLNCSSWRTVASFTGTQDSDWVVRGIDPPVKSRWWRLLISSNYGDKDYVWICGFGIRQVWRGDHEKYPEKEAKGEKDGALDAKPETATKAEKERGDDHKALTNRDLRKNDSSWQSLAGFQKLLIQALLSDRLLYFEDKLYIDYKRQRPVDFAETFLQQTSEQGWSLDYDPNFFCELAYEGFNPISVEIASDGDLMIQVLSLCFEPGRHVVDCLDVHISKNVRKRAKNYIMTIDTAYDDVMLGCIRQHGEAWLYRGQRCLHRKLRQDGYTGSRGISIAMHSIELWDKSGQLVAGDLGYTMGGVYVSQTGFHQDGTTGAGEVQLVLAAALLHKMGHHWFDLGQANPYKAALGAELLDRHAWLKRFRTVRDKSCRFEHGRISGQELLDHLLRAIIDRDAKWKRGPAPGLSFLATESTFQADASWTPGAAWEHCKCSAGGAGVQHFVLQQRGQGKVKVMSYLLTLPRLRDEGCTHHTAHLCNKKPLLPVVIHFHGSIDPDDRLKGVSLMMHVRKVFDEAQFGQVSAAFKGGPFIGLAPFCPVEKKEKRQIYWFKTCDVSAYEEWDLSEAARCREMEQLVVRVLAQVCAELPVDTSRVYFMGSSAGAYAALRLTELLPRLPAAVVAMSAYYPNIPGQDHDVDALAEKLQEVPRVWPLHCRFDTTCPVQLPHVAKLHDRLRDRCKAEVEWVPAFLALAPEADYHASYRRIFADPESFYAELLQSTRPDMDNASSYLDEQLKGLGLILET